MFYDRLVNLSLRASGLFSPQQPLTATTGRSLSSHEFEWAGIKPNASFQWHPCFGSDFKCARLQVRMDWQGHSSEANKTVEIAVIKVEATVPVTDPSYGGAVVLNPGGPGGSGIGQVLRGGKNVRTIVSAGPDAKKGGEKHFDVIGFDPRGINNTTPYMGCFPDSEAAAVWQIEQHSFGYIGTSDTSFDNVWASRRAMAEGCSKRLAEEGIAKHVSTAPVARDIIEIFERHGEWREQEAKRLLQTDLKSLSSDAKAQILSRTAHKKDKEMVQYWGFSYGTILGATLSAMYPDRIQRAILDGVADSHDYMAGGWTTNLVDTDLEFVKLAEYCWMTGPSKCPIYDDDGPAVIIDNVAAILAGFIKNPIGIPGTSTRGPQIVTYDDLKRVFRDVVYNPLAQFTQTARILAGIRDHNGTALAAFKQSGMLDLKKPQGDACLKAGPYSPECNIDAFGSGATFGIACTDGLSRLNQTKEEYREYARKIQAQSRLLGEDWATIQLPCTAWNARPEWRYEGDFTAKTAHPILFIGNTIDPVTPLRNAFLMSKGFEGSGVLHQDSEGHCTYGGVSLCSGRAVRKYFQRGELPKAKQGSKAKVCKQDRLPLDGYSDLEVEEVPVPEGEEDEKLWRALVGLNKEWP